MCFVAKYGGKFRRAVLCWRGCGGGFVLRRSAQPSRPSLVIGIMRDNGGNSGGLCSEPVETSEEIMSAKNGILTTLVVSRVCLLP